MENDGEKLKIFYHPIFEPVYEQLYFFIAALPMIVSEDFQKIILNSKNRYGNLGLSSNIYDLDTIGIDMKDVFDFVNKKIGLQKNGVKIKANFSNPVRSFGRIMVISLFNILEDSEFRNKLYTSKIYQFVKHIRNGAAHGNKFIFKPKVKKGLLVEPITWRGKKIDNSLEGKEVFSSFITCFDLILIIHDLSVEINK